MKKKIIDLIIFFLLAIPIFSAKIGSVNFSDSTLLIKLEENKNDTLISADEDTRLIYIEIQNLDDKSIKKFTSSIQNEMLKSNYFEEVLIEAFKDSLSITLQLEPKISYVVDSSDKKIELSLKRASKNKHLIVLDPGHGGKDPGALRGNVREKDIVLSVGKLVKDNLAKDFNVIMTRDKDFFVVLSERPKIANTNKAALFVSIHANASENTKANGVEVFYFSKKSSPYAERIANFENSIGEKYGESSDKIVQISGELAYKKNQENSIVLAKSIVNNISNATKLKNGGIHGANFAVLRGFNGTGVLIELGFVSNKADTEILTSSKYQEVMAREISDSIKEYLTR